MGLPRSGTSKEEFFGSVAMLFTIKNLDQVIALANDIPFGLGASGWTNDPEEAFPEKKLALTPGLGLLRYLTVTTIQSASPT